MPAKDKYHDIVIRALEKDGWEIVSEQVRLRIGEKRLWIDLSARNTAQNIVLIEVKSFTDESSPVEFLKQVLGQYLLYRAILEEIDSDTPLYLAITRVAYELAFNNELGQLITQKYGLNLVIYTVIDEEIVRWIPST